MKHRRLGLLGVAIAPGLAVVLGLGLVGCTGATKRKQRPEPQPTERREERTPADPEFAGQDNLDMSPGPEPLAATPISQVGFERGAPAHPAGCSLSACSDIVGLRQLDSSGIPTVVQHHAFPSTSLATATAARDLALQRAATWEPASGDTPGRLVLTCSSCGGIDLNKSRALSNVQFVSLAYDGLQDKTLVTLNDKRNPALEMTLRFPGRDSAEAETWASALRASAGVVAGSVSIPPSSPSATYTFNLGMACDVAWNWKTATAE